MKILYTTTVGLTMIFFKDMAAQLIRDGHTVDIACNEDEYKVEDFYRELGCNIYQIDWTRSPFSGRNIKAVKRLKALIAQNGYDIVHCHTPIAGVCTRFACRKFRKDRLRVFYTAHGFHFYKGAPLLNWMIYYPMERFCSRFTDVLLTITREDHALAEKKMKAKKIAYVPGVGIDVDRFAGEPVDRAEKRQSLGIPEDAFLLFSAGELNENKNQQVVIRAMAQIDDPGIHYMIAGKGDWKESLSELAKESGIAGRVHLLGYRDDLAELYHTADCYVLPSIREGLNVSVMEAMASGLPVICGRIRGNTDMIKDGVNGILFRPDDPDGLAEAIRRISAGECPDAASYNRETVRRYGKDRIIAEITELYRAEASDGSIIQKRI